MGHIKSDTQEAEDQAYGGWGWTQNKKTILLMGKRQDPKAAGQLTRNDDNSEHSAMAIHHLHMQRTRTTPKCFRTDVFAHRSPCVKTLHFCSSRGHHSTKPTKSCFSFTTSLGAVSHQTNLK